MFTAINYCSNWNVPKLSWGEDIKVTILCKYLLAFHMASHYFTSIGHLLERL